MSSELKEYILMIQILKKKYQLLLGVVQEVQTTILIPLIPTQQILIPRIPIQLTLMLEEVMKMMTDQEIQKIVKTKNWTLGPRNQTEASAIYLVLYLNKQTKYFVLTRTLMQRKQRKKDSKEKVNIQEKTKEVIKGSIKLKRMMMMTNIVILEVKRSTVKDMAPTTRTDYFTVEGEEMIIGNRSNLRGQWKTIDKGELVEFTIQTVMVGQQSKIIVI